MLYGINPVEAALGAGRRRMMRLHIKQGRLTPRLKMLLESAQQLGLPHTENTPAELARLCDSPDHQGAALHCGGLPTLADKECFPLAERERSLLVALDEVQDPRNLGAIVRSCAVFGGDGVVIPRHHASPLSPAASKASAGLLESHPIYSTANLARFLESCRRKGFWIAGASESGEKPLRSFVHDKPLILVLGNEGRGLRPIIRERCDFHLAIPTAKEGSLNVSAAAAVLLYQLTL